MLRGIRWGLRARGRKNSCDGESCKTSSAAKGWLTKPLYFAGSTTPCYSVDGLLLRQKRIATSESSNCTSPRPLSHLPTPTRTFRPHILYNLPTQTAPSTSISSQLTSANTHLAPAAHPLAWLRPPRHLCQCIKSRTRLSTGRKPTVAVSLLSGPWRHPSTRRTSHPSQLLSTRRHCLAMTQTSSPRPRRLINTCRHYAPQHGHHHLRTCLPRFNSTPRVPPLTPLSLQIPFICSYVYHQPVVNPSCRSCYDHHHTSSILTTSARAAIKRQSCSLAPSRRRPTPPQR